MANILNPKRGECLWKIRKLVVQGNHKDLRPTNAFNYVDIKYLKSGTNSRLYLARNESDQLVAIKMLKPNTSKNWAHEYELNLEITILSKLSHANIINIYSFGTYPRSFAVIEYLPGGTLNDILKSSTNITPLLPVRTVLTYGFSLISALQYLHDSVHPEIAIIHRDVKPQNMGFTADGQLKLFDFGLATCVPRRTLASDTYQLSGFTGTLVYMAPEVALGLPYCESVDVFSFAVVLWQLLTGCTPYPETMTPQEYQEKVARGGLRPSLPPDCGGIDKMAEQQESPDCGGVAEQQQEPGDCREQALREELLGLVGQCWGADPLSRPSAASVAQTLGQLMRKATLQQAVTENSSFGWRFIGQVARKLFRSFKSNSVVMVVPDCETNDTESLYLQLE